MFITFYIVAFRCFTEKVYFIFVLKNEWNFIQTVAKINKKVPYKDHSEQKKGLYAA